MTARLIDIEQAKADRMRPLRTALSVSELDDGTILLNLPETVTKDQARTIAHMLLSMAGVER